MPITEFKLEYTKLEAGAAGDTAAVVVAAGSASRMGGSGKQLLPLLGVPVLIRSLLAFQHAADVASIIVVARPADIPTVQRLCEEYGLDKVTDLVPGGATRAESVQNGVARCRDVQYIAIHDGARPLVSGATIAAVIADARTYGAATAAMPVKDTIKIADGAENIADTPDRSRLYAVQTPQVFKLSDYTAAVEKLGARIRDLTDDCAIMEQAGYRVHLSAGDYKNIKITTPEDIIIAEALLKSEGDSNADRTWL